MPIFQDGRQDGRHVDESSSFQDKICLEHPIPINLVAFKSKLNFLQFDTTFDRY